MWPLVCSTFSLMTLAENFCERRNLVSGCCEQHQWSVAAHLLLYQRDQIEKSEQRLRYGSFFLKIASKPLISIWFFWIAKRHGRILLFWPVGSNETSFFRSNKLVSSLASKFVHQNQIHRQKSVEILGENVYVSYLHLHLHSLVEASRKFLVCSQLGSRMWWLHYNRALLLLIHAVEILSHNSLLRYIVNYGRRVNFQNSFTARYKRLGRADHCLL